MTTEKVRRKTRKRLRALLLAMSLVLAGLMGVVSSPGTAHADDGGYAWSGAPAIPTVLYGWGYTTCPSNDTGCMSYPFTVNGTKYGAGDPWGYALRNCTSWVASKLAANGFNASGYGNAADWGANAQANNYTVDNTPTAGAVAWWAAGTLDGAGNTIGSAGHVAYVESASGTTANISEYNYGGTGVYHTRSITASKNEQVQYIHFADIAVTPPPPSTAHDIVVSVGSTLYGKTNPTDQWSTLTNGYASNLQVAGDHIAMVDTNGALETKQGVGGIWVTQITGFDEYEISSSLLVVRVGSDLYGKASLTDQWSLLTTGATPGFKVAGSRISFVSGGALLVKDGLYGQWTTQITGFDEYQLTSSLLAVRVGSTLYAKAALTDQWSTLTTGATPGFTATDSRIAFVSGSTLLVKDGVGGQWTTQIAGFDEYEMSSSVLAVRVGGTLYAKAALTDQWSTLTTGAPAGIRVSGNIISFVSGGMLTIKTGVGGTWLNEINGIDGYAIG